MPFPVLAAIAVSGVLSGISSAMSARSANKQAKQQAAAERDMTFIKGDEDRKTVLYQSLLEDYYRQKEKYRKTQGVGNYLAYARSNRPQYTNSGINQMLQYDSPNKVQDPGALPITPDFLNSQKNKVPTKLPTTGGSALGY